MGQPIDEIFAKPHEKPGREVELPGYFIDIHPVSMEEYSRFMEDGGYSKPELWNKEGWAWLKREGIESPLCIDLEKFNIPNHPVAGVSWYEADAYARWASKSLPSEAEWEKAARGFDGRRFPWGNNLPTKKTANYNNLKGSTTPIGSHPMGNSPFGCTDMAGNINNWCEDWYWENFYEYCEKEGLNEAPVLDTALCKELKIPTRNKVDKGGGFATPFKFLEVLSCPDKVAWPPTTRNLWNGFRCVLRT